jgi:N-terminal domain of (some) glycogen debranching enzymes
MSMKKLNRLGLRPGHLITYQGQAFLITDLQGFVGGGIEGFYYRQTRFLSKMRLAVDNAEPRNVSANVVDGYSWIAYYLAPSPAGEKAGPQPGSGEGGGEMVRHGIELQVNCYVANGLHLDVSATNHALAPAGIKLGWEFDADFADRAEAEQGERQQDAPVERSWGFDGGHGKLSFHYRHPQLSHATEIRFSGPLDLSEENGAVSIGLQLAPQQPVRFSVDIVPVFCGERVTPLHGCDAFGDPPIEMPFGDGVSMSTGNPQVQHAWDRAVSDLASLALLEGEGEERLTPAAGVPNYLALFGRDVLLTGFQRAWPLLRCCAAACAKSRDGMPRNMTSATTRSRDGSFISASSAPYLSSRKIRFFTITAITPRRGCF